MAIVNVVTIAAYRRIYWLRLIGLVQRSAATWRCVLHSSDEPGELSQRQCTATMTTPQTLSFTIAVTTTLHCTWIGNWCHVCACVLCVLNYYWLTYLLT